MRELFIRLRIILISLFFIIVITGLLVFPSGVSQLAEELENQESGIRILLALAALLADAMLLYIIYQELNFGRRNQDGLSVRSRAASAEVSLDSVQSSLESQIGKLDDIFAVSTRMAAARGRVVVEMEVDADDSINVRKKTSQIHREILKVVDKRMGLKLAAKPIIKFRLMSKPADVLPAAATPVSKEAAQALGDGAKNGADKGRFGGLFSRNAEPPQETPPKADETPPKAEGTPPKAEETPAIEREPLPSPAPAKEPPLVIKPMSADEDADTVIPPPDSDEE